MVSSLAIGVDIGGSHITSAVIDLDAQCILLPTLKRASINAQESVDEIVTAWCRVIEASGAQPGAKAAKIGIAMPGPFDYELGVSFMQEQGKFDSLYGINVKNLLAKKLSVPADNITFANDAACFLKGEVFGGAAKGCRKVLGLTLGTGFGSAIYQDGVVNDANLWCDPYKQGIAEDLFSTRWFISRYHELKGYKAANVKEILSDTPNHNSIQKLFAEFGENLGEYLLYVAGRFQFDTVVIGGNIARSFPLFSASIEAILSRHKRAITVKRTALNENASLVGAASVWKELQPVSVTYSSQKV